MPAKGLLICSIKTSRLVTLTLSSKCQHLLPETSHSRAQRIAPPTDAQHPILHNRKKELKIIHSHPNVDDDVLSFPPRQDPCLGPL